MLRSHKVYGIVGESEASTLTGAKQMFFTTTMIIACIVLIFGASEVSKTINR